MRRTLLLLSLVAVGLFVALLPVPALRTIPAVPEAAFVEPPATAAGVAYCGWVRSDSALEMAIAFAGTKDTQATVTVVRDGAVAATEQRALAPFGSIPISAVLPVGVEGAVVEFGVGPAAATALGNGALGTVAVECPATVPDVWVLGGGSTIDGVTLDLRLFNPFPEDAKISVRALSENGSEPDQSLEAISVPAQSSRTIALTDILGFREWLSVEIEQTGGRVIPTFVEQAGTGGAAVMSGVSVANDWYFPFGGVAEIANTLVLVNPSATPIGYQIARATATGPGEELDRGSIDLRHVSTIPVDAGDGFIVQADAPLAAFLVGRGDGGRASVTGSSVSAAHWVLPGAGAIPGTTVVVLNPSTSDVTVTVIGRLGQLKVLVPAGGVTSVPIGDSDGGVEVRAGGQVVVGWYAVAEADVAYAIGVPVVGP